ncbi:MAG: hypothetical protein IKD04_03795 [Clostridia bacterium]|nr:hypothetical protein [Clostridia bacterium]
MERRIIRILSAVLCVSILLTLTACGDSGRTVIDPDSLETSTVITTESNDTGSQDENGEQTVSGSSNLRFGVTNTKKMPNFISKIKNNTLTVLSSSAGGSSVEFDTQLEIFKELTGIDLKFDTIVVPWSQMPEKLASMVMAGSAPDLFDYAQSSWLSLLKQPYWDDLNKYIDFDDALWKDVKNVAPAISTYNGKRVAFFTTGYGLTGNTIIYNTKLVQDAAEGDASLYDPLDMFYDGKWTWSALQKYVEKISDPDDGIYGIALPNNRISAFIATTGNDIIRINSSTQKLEYNLENKNVTRAFNYAKSLIKLSDLPGTWQGMSMVLSDSLGFFCDVNGAWPLKDSADTIKAVKAGKILAVPFPRDDNVDVYYSGSLSDPTCIPLKAKNPWLASAWLYFKRYMAYNPNKELSAKNEKLYKETYGWPDKLYMLNSPEAHGDVFKKVNVTYTMDVIPFGERLADFDQDTYWSLATNVNVLTSQMVEQVGPSLKTAINRFNSK